MGSNTLYYNSLGLCSLALICLSVQEGKVDYEENYRISSLPC